MTDNSKQNKKIKLYDGFGCLGILAVLLTLMAIIGFIIPLIRQFFSGLIGVKPIDEETGETISIPWAGIALFIGVAILLVLIERLYHWIKTKAKT